MTNARIRKPCQASSVKLGCPSHFQMVIKPAANDIQNTKKNPVTISRPWSSSVRASRDESHLGRRHLWWRSLLTSFPLARSQPRSGSATHFRPPYRSSIQQYVKPAGCTCFPLPGSESTQASKDQRNIISILYCVITVAHHSAFLDGLIVHLSFLQFI
jgi:hypothetical protein